MPKARCFVVWSIVAVIFGASQGFAAHPLAGKWVNADGKTSSITRLEIREEADGWEIHAWASCGPDECDWGTAALYMAADGEEVPFDAKKLKYGVAHWKQLDGAARTFLAMRVEEGELIIETVDVFEKTSGQPNMRFKDSFKKAQ